jgi:ketosteroid isomerase-like protein
MSTIGVIDAGHIGRNFSIAAIGAGDQIVISNSKGPDRLADLVSELGPQARAATGREAAVAGDFALVAIPLRGTAGDDPDAKQVAADLYEEFGFDAVDVGGLADAWRLDADQPTFAVRQNRDELVANLARAQRHLRQLQPQSPERNVSVGDAEAEIRELLSAYERSVNTSNTQLAVSSYAPDGVFMPTAAPTARGAQLREAYARIFATIRLDVSFTIDELVVDGGPLAYAMTRSQGTQTVLASGASTPAANREVFIFRRHEGAWKISRYMFNKSS